MKGQLWAPLNIKEVEVLLALDYQRLIDIFLMLMQQPHSRNGRSI
jgi:hypothetical protein